MKNLGQRDILLAFIFASLTVCSDAFVAKNSVDSPQAADHGATIFRNSCSVCHSTRSDETKVGPSLYGVLRKGSSNSERVVRQIVADGKGTMPAFKEKLGPSKVDDLIAYLKTL